MAQHDTEFRNHGRAGFTLVELRVAVTIRAIGIGSIGQIFAISSRNATYGRTETMAVGLAREIKEKIMCENFDDVTSVFHGVDTDNAGSVTRPCEMWAAHLDEQLGVNARGTITVRDSNEDAQLREGMLGILVEITWKADAETYRFPLNFTMTTIGT